MNIYKRSLKTSFVYQSLLSFLAHVTNDDVKSNIDIYHFPFLSKKMFLVNVEKC